MSGHLTGAQAELRAQLPNVLYVHCRNHVLDVISQEVAEEACLVSDELNFVQGVTTAMGESSKQNTLFFSFVV